MSEESRVPVTLSESPVAPTSPSEGKLGDRVERVVWFGELSLDYNGTGLELESVTYRVADNPNFNPLAAYLLSWNGVGHGGGLKPPLGQPCHIKIMPTWKIMDLVAGKTYYKNAVAFVNIDGGATQPVSTATESFVA